MKFLAAGLLLAVCMTSTARADDPTPSQLLEEGELVGLLNVTTEGVSKDAREGFIESVENSLRLAGFRVVPSKTLLETLAESSYVDGCYFGPCLSAVHRRTAGKVRLVVIARITGTGSAYGMIVSLLDTRDGAVLSQKAKNCPVCTVDDALAEASNLVIEAVTSTRSARNPRDRDLMKGQDGQSDDQGKRSSGNRKAGITGAVLMLGAGIAGGVVGGLMLQEDRDTVGYTALGAGGAFVLSGITLLAISSTF